MRLAQSQKWELGLGLRPGRFQASLERGSAPTGEQGLHSQLTRQVSSGVPAMWLAPTSMQKSSRTL